MNIFIARILCPFAFFSMLPGLWFIPIKQSTLGNTLIEMLLTEFPGTSLFLGFPMWMIFAVISIMGLLAIMEHRFYKADINLVYGPVLEKIQDLIADMEVL